MAYAGPRPPPPASAPVSLARYSAGVAITVGAILSQYGVPQLFPSTLVLYGNLPGDLFVVYGVPVLAFALLVGRSPLRDWAKRMTVATWEGLRWYGLLSLLALLIVIGLSVVYSLLDPSALSALNRPNPALEQARGDPWFYVGFSFVVGAFEETIFRGWIFGYWRDRPGAWFVPATWTSVVFAGVHLYYATTYGLAAPLVFPTLFLMGFALAATYRFSGGNLVVPSLLHGANDATAYLTLINLEVGLILHYLVILVGAAVGLVHYLRPSGGPPNPDPGSMGFGYAGLPPIHAEGERMSSTQNPSGPS